MSDIRVVRSWDELPPVVQQGGESFSTRVLERQHRDMADQIAQLRAALQPFAALAEHYPTDKAYGNRPTSGVLFEVSSSNKTAAYTVEDLHAAAKALESSAAQKD